jgi:toxin YoeB
MGNNWTDTGWSEYVYWQTQDRKTLRRINKLLNDIQRNGSSGIGNPEALTGNWNGWYSRRIDEKNRLIYCIRNGNTIIASCRGHYGDK